MPAGAQHAEVLRPDLRYAPFSLSVHSNQDKREAAEVASSKTMEDGPTCREQIRQLVLEQLRSIASAHANNKHRRNQSDT